jgi:hypothetical protein
MRLSRLLPAVQPISDVLRHREMGKERVALEHIPEAPRAGWHVDPGLGTNSTVPSISIRPRFGVASNARQLSVSVLPDPDGPSSAITRSVSVHAAFSVNPSSRLTIETESTSVAHARHASDSK